MKDVTTLTENAVSSPDIISNLPTEFIVMMYRRMSVRDALAFSQSNKRLHKILNESENKLWAFYLKRDFPTAYQVSPGITYQALYKITYKNVHYHGTTLIKILNMVHQERGRTDTRVQIKKFITELEECILLADKSPQLETKIQEVTAYVRNELHSHLDEPGLNPLTLAIRNQRIDLALYLIEINAYINTQTSTGQTPLYLAVWYRTPEIVSALLKHPSISVDEKNEQFKHAIKDDRLEVVQTFIENGVALSHTGESITELLRSPPDQIRTEQYITYTSDPLNVAINNSSSEVVFELMNRGAEINESAMVMAIQTERANVVKALVNAGLPVSDRLLIAAIKCKNVEILEILISKIDKVSDEVLKQAMASGKESIFLAFLIDRLDFNPNFVMDGTPLIFKAVSGAYLNLFQLLVKKGAKLDVCDKSGFHILSRAAQLNLVDVVKTLIDKGVQPHPVQSPLCEAANLGHDTMVELLIEYKHDVNKPDEAQLCAIHLALNSPQKEPQRVRILKMLVDAGADINARLESNHTPLMLAAGMGSCDAVEYLIQKGADPFVRSRNDVTLFGTKFFTREMTALDFTKASSKEYHLIKRKMDELNPSRLTWFFSSNPRSSTSNQRGDSQQSPRPFMHK
jgi:ankyrin repeat protein